MSRQHSCRGSYQNSQQSSCHELIFYQTQVQPILKCLSETDGEMDPDLPLCCCWIVTANWHDGMTSLTDKQPTFPFQMDNNDSNNNSNKETTIINGSVYRLVTYSVPTCCLNRCRLFVNFTYEYKFQWNGNQNTKIFFQQKTLNVYVENKTT